MPPIVQAAVRIPDGPRLQALVDAQWSLAERHGGLLQAALAGATAFEEFRRYPAGDVVDAVHGTRFFFHAHPGAYAARGEFGHFHVFLDPDSKGGTSVTHLAGIAVDGHGLPVRLFTVNRWVTNERWQTAGALVGRARTFECRTSGRLAPVARWLSAAVRAWSAAIDGLLEERDLHVARLCAGGASRSQVFEDRNVEVLAECPVALMPPVQSGALS